VAQVVSRRPLTAEDWVSPRVIFVVDKATLGQGFLRVFRFSPVSIIPPWLSILICHPGDEL
jgi:hypothetical protein